MLRRLRKLWNRRKRSNSSSGTHVYSWKLTKPKFAFDELPLNLKQAVIQKMNFEEWVTLRQCSKSSHSVCSAISDRLTFNCHYIRIKNKVQVWRGHYHTSKLWPWRRSSDFPILLTVYAVRVECQLGLARLKNICKSFEVKRVTSRCVALDALLACDVADFANLLEILQATVLLCTVPLDPQFFNIPYALKLTRLELAQCAFTDEQFVNLQADTIIIGNAIVSVSALICVFQNWQKGNRQLKRLDLGFNTSIREALDVALKTSEVANLVWSLEMHHHSVASFLPLDAIPFQSDFSYYYMWKPSDIKNTCALKVRSHSIEFSKSAIDFNLYEIV